MKLEYFKGKLLADGVPVAEITDPAAAKRLDEILWLHPHICEVARKGLQIVVDLQKLGFPEVGSDPDGMKKFYLEANFILELLNRQKEGTTENVIDSRERKA